MDVRPIRWTLPGKSSGKSWRNWGGFAQAESDPYECSTKMSTVSTGGVLCRVISHNPITYRANKPDSKGLCWTNNNERLMRPV